MGLGMFDTSDNSLMVYIFGPEKSRPYTQSVHTLVGVGFISCIGLASPFLPDEEGTERQNSVCPNEDKNLTSTAPISQEVISDFPMMGGLYAIAWPYLIVGCWHFLTAAGDFPRSFDCSPD